MERVETGQNRTRGPFLVAGAGLLTMFLSLGKKWLDIPSMYT